MCFKLKKSFEFGTVHVCHACGPHTALSLTSASGAAAEEESKLHIYM